MSFKFKRESPYTMPRCIVDGIKYFICEDRPYGPNEGLYYCLKSVRAGEPPSIEEKTLYDAVGWLYGDKNWRPAFKFEEKDKEWLAEQRLNKLNLYGYHGRSWLVKAERDGKEYYLFHRQGKIVISEVWSPKQETGWTRSIRERLREAETFLEKGYANMSLFMGDLI